MNFVNIISSLFFLKFITCVEQNIFEFVKNENNQEATKCIVSVIQNNVPCGTPITLVSSKENANCLISNIRNDNCYCFYVRSFQDHSWPIPTEVYTIVAQDIREFLEGMTKLTHGTFWNPKARHIIKLRNAKDNDIIKVFDKLLRYNVFKAILIRRLSNDSVTVYTYLPFENKNYCDKILEIVNIGDCVNSNTTEYFTNKRIKMQNCTVMVAAAKGIPNFIPKEEINVYGGRNTPGLEQFLLQTIADKEEIDIQFRYADRDSSFGVVLQNHTATGLLEFIQKDEVDIGAGGIILMKNRIDMFDYIYGYNYAAFKVFTPAADEEVWKDFYSGFSVNTWILIIIAFCAVTATCIIIGKRQPKILHDRIYLTLKLWGYFYSNTSKKMSKDKKLRRIMVFWVWFTFFICNFYNTALYSLLTSRDKIKRDITFENIEKLNMEPCISIASLTYFKFAYNKTLPAGRGIPECKYTDSAMDYVVSTKGAYAIEMEHYYTLNIQKYLDEDGHSKLDVWDFSSNNVMAMYLTRGFPLRNEFQKYSWELFESGILKEHLKKLHSNSHKLMALHKRHFKKMILADLRIHFLILAVGSMLSLFCFIMEFIRSRK